MTAPAAMTAPPRAAIIALTTMAPLGSGYFLGYLYRVMNAVIAPDLVAELNLTAADLGFLTSAYFMTYAAAQLPLGVLLDRYGPRRTQTGMLLIAATGAVVFGLAHSFALLTVGRALIGMGLCGGLMSCLKANSMWWPRERLPLVNGICGGFGAAGALAGTVPLQYALHFLDWRAMFVVLAAFTVAASLLIYFVVPEKPAVAATPRLGAQIREMRAIYASAFYWRTSIMICANQGIYLAYQTLWLAPWLRDVAGYDRAEIANTLLILNFSQFVGVIASGVLADQLRRTGVSVRACIIGALVISLAVQFMFAFEATAFATPLAVVYALAGAATVLVYSILNQHFPTHLAGRVNTMQNTMMFSTAFAAQWGIGAIINLFPAVEPGRYQPAAHQAAFLAMIAVEIAAFAFCVWPRRARA